MLFAKLLNRKSVRILWELVSLTLKAKNLKFEALKVGKTVVVIRNSLLEDPELGRIDG